MLNSALFAIVEEAGTAVMILTEEVEQAEFLNSRLTRAEARRQLLILAAAVGVVPAEARSLLPELEWDAWSKVAHELGQTGAGADEFLWFTVRSLVPATLLWLQVYRRNQPELFAFTL